MVELTIESGEVVKLPLTVDDCPASAWFKMSAYERELDLKGAECEPLDFMFYIEKAVNEVVPIPSSIPFGLPAKLLKKKEWRLEPEFIANVKGKGVDTVELTVLNIYRHLLWVSRTCEMCAFPIEYDGTLWNITPNLKNLAYEGEFTAQETVEVLKLQDMFEAELSEARKKEFDFTKIAASDYGLTKYQVALLLRPIDENGLIEPLPMGEQAIEKYINERVEELENLPYSVILSVRFFFLTTLTVLSVLIAAEEILKEHSNTRPIG